MNAMRRQTRALDVALLMASLLLVACGDGPAPAGEASALADDAAAIQAGAAMAIARTPAASADRAGSAPARAARASDAAAGMACPSPPAEPAASDAGRELMQAADPDAVVPEPEPEPVPAPPESSADPG